MYMPMYMYMNMYMNMCMCMYMYHGLFSKSPRQTILIGQLSELMEPNFAKYVYIYRYI